MFCEIVRFILARNVDPVEVLFVIIKLVFTKFACLCGTVFRFCYFLIVCIISRHGCKMFVHCVSKNVPPLVCYNFDISRVPCTKVLSQSTSGCGFLHHSTDFD